MFGSINATLFEIISIWGVLFIAILGLGYAFLLKTQITLAQYDYVGLKKENKI